MSFSNVSGMFLITHLLLLLAGVVAGAKNVEYIPGKFIIEYAENTVSTSTVEQLGAIKTMDFNSELFKGASIEFSNDKLSRSERIAQLSKLPGIRNVWAQKLVARPNPQKNSVALQKLLQSTPSNQVKSKDTYSPHVQTQVDKLRAKGITGKGVKIAIIDTGIDYTNKALGGCFGPGCLVVGGYDFVGDNFNGTNNPVPDDDPLDTCNGHGTHVAGIIAARPNEYGFTGAAPDVKLAAYRVFGCDGSASDDVILAAFLRAQQEGAHIITASLGGDGGWPEDMANTVVSRIVASGVIVTIAAGNSGEDGLFQPGSPAAGKGVAAIASFDNTLLPELLMESHYSVPGRANQSFKYGVGLPRHWADVKLPLWTPSFDTTQKDQGCNPFPADTPNLSDKIVLIRRGTCALGTKAQNAAARGAKYVLFYNNVPGVIYVELEDLPSISGVGMVSAELGATWVGDLAAKKVVTLDMSDPKTTPTTFTALPNTDTGGFLSSFTSWGPTWEGGIDPAFGTPGGQIISTFPVALGSYAVLSGTSMATPLAAAIYALLLNVRKTSNPLELRNILASTAKPVQLNINGSISSLLAPVAQQGAGMIQAYDAAFATTVLSDSGLAFNDTVRLTEKKFTIWNTGHDTVTYELDVVGAATAYTFSKSMMQDPFPGLELDGSFATLHLSEYKVTVPAGAKHTITVKVTPPTVNAAQLPVYGGYILLNSTNRETLSLPYLGIAGDMTAPTVMNSAYLSSISAAPDFAPINGTNSTFSFPKKDITEITDDLPVAVINLVFGSPLVKIEILSTSNPTTSLGEAIGSPYSWNPRSLDQIPWNGQLANNSFVPAGSYKFRVSALHIFGNPSNRKDYDVIETTSFAIRYT